MTELLAAIIMSVCPASADSETTPCMEEVVNCAVELQDLITHNSIIKCLDKRQKGDYNARQSNVREQKESSTYIRQPSAR